MESSQNLETLTWEDAFPSSLELKDIKQKLLSGEKEQILESAEQIKRLMKNDKSMVELIRADVTEFLCDAIYPFDDDTVRTLYNCLELFTNHIEFFHHGHACFTIESLIRSIYFSSKNSQDNSSLAQSLNLLILIVQRYNTYNVACEKKTIESLLQIIPLLLNTATTVYCKYQAGELLLGVLKLNILSWSQEFCENILKYVLSWFNYIDEILVSANSLKDGLILLYCAISCAIFRFLDSQDNLSGIEENVNYQLKIAITHSICNFLINVAASYINNIPINTFESNYSFLEIFLQCLAYLYSDNITSNKSWVTHGLSEQGFFHFIVKIVSVTYFNNCQKLQKLCILLLSYMIMFLSQDVFQFPELWSNGQHDFYNEVHEGISRLPLDFSLWLEVLTNSYSPNSCKLAVLLFYYFYSMTVKSQDILEDIYPSIINFINISNELMYLPLVKKILWFVFVVSQLSHGQHFVFDGETDAANKLISILERQEDLSLVYTHHPALLYWAFSSKINKTVQSEIVRLWYINKTSDCKVVEDLIATSSDVRFVIMDIMQNGYGQVLESAFLSLKSILLKTKDNDLACNIWLLLPQVLAKYSTASISATNADYLIELASLKSPSCLDAAKIIRIASLLPEIFLKSDLIAVVPSFVLIFRLMELGFQMEDFRVLCSFLRVDGFVQKILEGISAEISDTSVYGLKIITLLWKNSYNSDASEDFKKVRINKEIIPKVLDNTNIEILSAALDLLREMLLTSFCSNIFEIEENSSLIEVLFFQIQGICVKNIPEVTKKCWLCLKLFLMISPQQIVPMYPDLIADPFLQELINFYLPDLKDYPEMKDFLVFWLNRSNENLEDCCFTRKIFGKFFVETVQNIASCQNDSWQEDDLMLKKEILKVGIQFMD